VLEGSVEHGKHSDTALTADDTVRGMALLCCAHTAGDLVVESRVVAAAGDLPVRKMPCRVAAIEALAPDVKLIRLQMPASERFQYLAGQYVDLLLRDGVRRSYSLACAPHLADTLELHVRHMPGGRFTDTVFGVAGTTLKEKDILRLEGPMGTFFLREDSTRPIVLLASGTGFAPIKAVIEYALHKGVSRPMTLYWGGRRPHDLYMGDLCEQWARDVAGFRYVPVVSDALAQDNWQGRTGFVHRAVMEDLPDLSGHDVYACGAPVVIDAARRDFTCLCALPEESFHADSFTSQADVASAA